MKFCSIHFCLKSTLIVLPFLVQGCTLLGMQQRQQFILIGYNKEGNPIIPDSSAIKSGQNVILKLFDTNYVKKYKVGPPLPEEMQAIVIKSIPIYDPIRCNLFRVSYCNWIVEADYTYDLFSQSIAYKKTANITWKNLDPNISVIETRDSKVTSRYVDEICSQIKTCVCNMRVLTPQELDDSMKADDALRRHKSKSPATF